VWARPMAAQALVEEIRAARQPTISGCEVPAHVKAAGVDRAPDVQHNIARQRHRIRGSIVGGRKLQEDG
jgi:hypothetical protein